MSDTLNYANDYWQKKVKPIAAHGEDSYPAFLFGFSAGMAYAHGIPYATLVEAYNELAGHAAALTQPGQ
jgi:hypothetical protein